VLGHSGSARGGRRMPPPGVASATCCAANRDRDPQPGLREITFRSHLCRKIPRFPPLYGALMRATGPKRHASLASEPGIGSFLNALACHFEDYMIAFFDRYLIAHDVPITRQSRAASTTSRVTVLSLLISLMRLTCAMSRSISRKLPAVIVMIAATAS